MSHRFPESLPRHHHHRRGARQPPSCTQCQQRKIKCDRKLPCNRCTRGRRAGACFYAIAGAAASTTLSTANVGGQGHDATEERSSRIDGVTNCVEDGAGQIGTVASSGRAAEAAGVDVTALARKVKELEERVEELSAARHAEPSAGILTEQCIFRKGRVFGRSHWMHHVDEFPGVVKLDKTRQEDPGIRNVLEKCEKLEKEAKARRAACERHEPRPSLRELVPSKDISDGLVKAYFRTVGAVFRVLHVPSFMSQYKRYWEDSQSSNEPFVTKLLLVLAIGTCFSQQELFASLRSSAVHWIYTTQNWLLSPAWESRITISCVQVHCLLLLARQARSVGANQLWASASSPLQTAMQLGLHRSPKLMPGMTIFEAEMRRRLWATVAELVVQTSIDAGAAPILSPRDFDCEPPANIDDHQLNEDALALPTPKPLNQFTESTTQILLLRSLPARLEIARYLNHFRADSSYSAALRLHAELSNSLASYTHFSVPALQPVLPFFQTKLLALLTHRFLTCLHQLFVFRAPRDPTHRVSRTACFSASLHLLSLAQLSTPPSEFQTSTTTSAISDKTVNTVSTTVQHSSPSPLPRGEDDFNLLAFRASGMFSEAILGAAIAICHELVARHRERRERYTVSIYYHHESHLTTTTQSEAEKEKEEQGRQAIEGFVKLSMERIKTVGDPFKSHLLFVVVLAMLTSSDDDEEANVRAAIRGNLGFCLEVLKERVEASGGGRFADDSAHGTAATAEMDVMHGVNSADGVTMDGVDDFQLFGMDSEFNFDLDFTNAAQVMQSLDGLF